MHQPADAITIRFPSRISQLLLVYRLLSLPLLFVIVLGLAACTGTPQRPQAPISDSLALSAQNLVAQGDHLAAAQLYLSAAKTAPENQRPEMRLRAAELLAAGDHAGQLEQVLAAIRPQGLDWAQKARYRLLNADLALARRQPEIALDWLAEISAPENLPDFGRQYYQLRAQAYALTGNPLEAARQLVRADSLPADPEQQLANQYSIWEQLSSLPDEKLQAAHSAAPPDVYSGWLDLVLVTRTARGQWNEAFDGWRQLYPGHPAEQALLPDLLSQVGQFAEIDRIAVLLPFSGRAAEAADAIRDGLLAAFYGSREEQHPVLQFYDTGGSPERIPTVYQQAVNEGAQFVIGPLLKESIEALSASPELPVPVLALNHSDAVSHESATPLYQFGLAPEDEAQQVAMRIVADGHQRAVALVPDNAWGRRVYAAFDQELTRLGGQVLDIEYYESGSADFAGPIRRALNLDDSDNRHRAIQNLLGEKLNFEQRRRRDVQAVVVLAFPREARQIKPQLRFHHAGNLPVYSTSHVYQPSVDPGIDRDMDGMLFCDVPWTLDRDGEWAAHRKQVETLWPGRGLRYQRLFALGFDAYQVVPWLDTLGLPGFSRFPGATGALSLDETRRLHRSLEWARFSGGMPEKIPAPVSMSMEGQHEQESDRR
jgi:outer membrane PBP1 activator LpoA protein